MKIELSKPFASSSLVEEYDVVQVKKALNRLGYYFPYEKVGITGIADKEVFETLKKFQKDRIIFLRQGRPNRMMKRSNASINWAKKSPMGSISGAR